jgi:hypothetical protein
MRGCAASAPPAGLGHLDAYPATRLTRGGQLGLNLSAPFQFPSASCF